MPKNDKSKIHQDARKVSQSANALKHDNSHQTQTNADKRLSSASKSVDTFANQAEQNMEKGFKRASQLNDRLDQSTKAFLGSNDINDDEVNQLINQVSKQHYQARLPEVPKLILNQIQPKLKNTPAAQIVATMQPISDLELEFPNVFDSEFLADVPLTAEEEQALQEAFDELGSSAHLLMTKEEEQVLDEQLVDEFYPSKPVKPISREKAHVFIQQVEQLKPAIDALTPETTPQPAIHLLSGLWKIFKTIGDALANLFQFKETGKKSLGQTLTDAKNNLVQQKHIKQEITGIVKNHLEKQAEKKETLLEKHADFLKGPK